MNKETTQCQTENCKATPTETEKEGAQHERQEPPTAEDPDDIIGVGSVLTALTILPLADEVGGDPVNIPEMAETAVITEEPAEQEPPAKKPRKSPNKSATPEIKKDNSVNDNEDNLDANSNNSDEDHGNSDEEEGSEELKKIKKKAKKYTSGLKRREDVILKDEGVARRKILDVVPEAVEPPPPPPAPGVGLRVRLHAQRYVAIKSGPLCRGKGNKKCLFGKGDVVDVLCPANKSKDGKVMMVIHKSKRDKEFMRQRYLGDYEPCLSPKGEIECDFPVAKRGRLKLQGMVECYCVLVAGKDYLWVDKRLAEELPPGTTPIMPPDILVPASTHFGPQDGLGGIVMVDVRQSVLGQPLLEDEGQKGGPEFGEEDVGGGVDKEAMTSLPLFQGPLHTHYSYHRGNGGGGGGGGGGVVRQRVVEGTDVGQQTMGQVEEQIIDITSDEVSGIPPIASPVTVPPSTSNRMNDGDEYLSLPLATQCREQLRSPDPNKK